MRKTTSLTLMALIPTLALAGDEEPQQADAETIARFLELERTEFTSPPPPQGEIILPDPNSPLGALPQYDAGGGRRPKTEVKPVRVYTGSSYEHVVYRYVLDHGQCGLGDETRRGLRRFWAWLMDKELTEQPPWLPEEVVSRLNAEGGIEMTHIKDNGLKRVLHTVMVNDNGAARSLVLDHSSTFDTVILTPDTSYVSYVAGCATMAVGKANSDPSLPAARVQSMVEAAADHKGSLVVLEGIFKTPLETALVPSSASDFSDQARISLLFDLASNTKEMSNDTKITYRSEVHVLALAYSSDTNFDGSGSLSVSAAAGASEVSSSAEYTATRSVELRDMQTFLVAPVSAQGGDSGATQSETVKTFSVGAAFDQLNKVLIRAGKQATTTKVNDDLKITIGLPRNLCTADWNLEAMTLAAQGSSVSTVTTIPFNITYVDASRQTGAASCELTVSKSNIPQDTAKVLFSYEFSPLESDSPVPVRKLSVPLSLTK